MPTRETVLYCHSRPKSDGTGEYFTHFYPSANVTRTCDSEANIFKVSVKESEETPDCYWGWWNNEKERFVHVYLMKVQVEICFPGSIEDMEKQGAGYLLPVSVTVVD